MKQEYVLKKFVKANDAAEALRMDRKTPVSEVFLVDNRPSDKSSTSATGFQVVTPDDNEN